MKTTTLNMHTLKIFGVNLAARRVQAFIMVLAAATFWGLSGTAAQWLFQNDGFTPSWLVTARMSISGIVLLGFAGLNNRGPRRLAVWQHRRDWLQLIIFALFGLLAVQYTYFAAIRLGNAATATFLQYLGPSLLTIYFALRLRKMPDGLQIISVLLAAVGTLLLVTDGSLRQFAVPARAVVWGIISAVALAFYTAYPVALLERWGPLLPTGWAMLIGGFVCAMIAPPWRDTGMHWSWSAVFLVAFVVFFGTLLAFYLYLASLQSLTPVETSLLASFEPLSAAVASVLLLHVHLGVAAALGGLCITATVVVLAIRSIR